MMMTGMACSIKIMHILHIYENVCMYKAMYICIINLFQNILQISKRKQIEN